MKGKISGVICDECMTPTTSLWRRHPITQAYLCNVCTRISSLQVSISNCAGGLKAYSVCGKKVTRKRKRKHGTGKPAKKPRRRQKRTPVAHASSRDSLDAYLDKLNQSITNAATKDDEDDSGPFRQQMPLRDVTNLQEIPVTEESTIITNKSLSLEEIFSICAEPTLVGSQCCSAPSTSSPAPENPGPAIVRSVDVQSEISKCSIYDESFNQDYNLNDINDFNIVQPPKMKVSTWQSAANTF